MSDKLISKWEAARLAGEGGQRIDWPDPTPEQLASPLFDAIWSAIRTWDINVPGAYGGYCGATGNHVRAILDEIERLRLAALPEREGWQPFPPPRGPRDESIVEVKLRDGTERLAWFSKNISEPGDWDFVPVEPGQDEPGDAESIGHDVVAWRLPSGAQATVTAERPKAWFYRQVSKGIGHPTASRVSWVSLSEFDKADFGYRLVEHYPLYANAAPPPTKEGG